MSRARAAAGVSQETLARFLGVSFVTVNRWERGASSPSPAQRSRIQQLCSYVAENAALPSQPLGGKSSGVFASHGVRRRSSVLPLFGESDSCALEAIPGEPILERLRKKATSLQFGNTELPQILSVHREPAPTVDRPFAAGVSAGKNSYTYDAHTYHTKVPPQGIAELISHYLPKGGLVLDPFGGSGMTGVAALATGSDCILSELSPAACFIASRFTASVAPNSFAAAVRAVLREVDDIRNRLYTTTCRECGRPTEILYTVWSYRVLCSACGADFQLWDVCRRYGKRVREHKILKEISCPSCAAVLNKSRLRRTAPEPVQLGYMCCGSRQQEVVHPLSDQDSALISSIETAMPLAEGFYPTAAIPDGVNLNQPKRHGLTSIDRFYTRRNLAALSHLWLAIHRIGDPEIAGQVAFAFTSLYQRVSRLSEFRFWGGSGNTARFNVPFISNESNVFVTFERKARTIQDHLETTAQHYKGRIVIANGSATNLEFLPDSSIDLVFTDPPFGSNINYSEMNLLWESWLGRFTDASEEAIVSRAQGKGIDEYEALMTKSFAECYRVLRPGHWLLVVFMNTSARVWGALSSALSNAGFEISQADSFDKQHGTFKQFVSPNTAGEDLVLHCRKPESARTARSPRQPSASPTGTAIESVLQFLKSTDVTSRVTVFLHVGRESEVDVRKLYSEWMAQAIQGGVDPLDYSAFRGLVKGYLTER